MFDEYKTKENKNWTKDKIELQHIQELSLLAILKILLQSRTEINFSLILTYSNFPLISVTNFLLSDFSEIYTASLQQLQNIKILGLLSISAFHLNYNSDVLII